MKAFKINEEGSPIPVEYYVVKCHICGSVFRHDSGMGSFGKPIRSRVCLVCGTKIPIDDQHCLDHDPMRGEFKAEFKTGNEMKKA
jgi:hypothetical protein